MGDGNAPAQEKLQEWRLERGDLCSAGAAFPARAALKSMLEIVGERLRR
jgi:hypothetical protein